MTHDTSSILDTVLDHAIDYAGLFPPASLTFDSTMANYGRYLASAQSQWLGNVIIPAGKLTQLSGKSLDYGVSCLLPACRGADDDQVIAALEEMTAYMDRREASARVCPESGGLVAVEVRCEDASAMRWLARVLPKTISIYIELPSSAELPRQLDVLTEFPHFCGKIRTGGIIPELIPSAAEVVLFLTETARRSLRFKATAGLHHPLPARRPLTYTGPEPSATMHGFVNVILAATLAYQGRGSVEELISLIEDQDVTHFRVTADTISWKDEEFTRDDVRHGRSHGMIGFGSCSLEEPVEDLRELGWLP